MNPRSKIEGNLARSLQTDISLRAAAAPEQDDGLMRITLSCSSEAPYLRASFFEEPWVETLGHGKDEVDLSRLNTGAPVLANHRTGAYTETGGLATIGKVERAWIEGKRLHADIVLSRRESLADMRQDIQDGLLKNVSIGYQINERLLTKKAEGKGYPEYRATRWTPFEISLVDIPADPTVGLGRSAQTPAHPTHYRVIDLPQEGATTQGKTMTDETLQTPEANATAAATATATRAAAAPAAAAGPDPIAAERERVREITALSRQFNLQPDGDSAIQTGMSLDNFRSLVLSRQKDRGSIRFAESPEIGMSAKEVAQYSFCRALRAAEDPANAHRLAPFEMEASRAAQDKRGDSRSKDREAALTIPADVLSRSLQNMQRDLVVATPANGGNLVAQELLSSSFIELLRNAMVINRLGVTFLPDLNGDIYIPSQTGTATSYWLQENGEPSESSQTIGQISLKPKTVGMYTDYSRKLMLQSSIAVEAFVRNDLATGIGLAIQQAAINGTGTTGQPLGILNTAGVAAVEGGANGAVPTYANIIDLEGAITSANADIGEIAYLTNAIVRSTLLKHENFPGSGKAIWDTDSGGRLVGHAAVVTNAVPRNLSKGSATNCSAIIAGVFSQLLIGLWGGLDIMLDPYSNSKNGAKRIVALQDVDIALRHPESFAVMTDALEG